VLLLDEPLSNLDAQLRVEMRGEIRQLQQTLGITAIYVTHDQEEALAISDRIAVMRSGGLEQVAPPDEIYRHPKTPFVAEFMGTTNLLSGIVTGANAGWAQIRVGGAEFSVAGSDAREGETVSFSLRPEMLRPLASDAALPPGWARLEAQLAHVEFLGALTRMEMRLAGGTALRLAALEVPQGWAREEAPVAIAYDPSRITVFRAPGAR
jgi:ABC-type Fe3+/spermidine/putrescine transport system ATPase subunit